MASSSVTKKSRFSKKVYGMLIFIGIWWLGSLMVNSELILPDPLSVMKRLIEISLTGQLFLALLFTLSKGVFGLLLALLIGTPIGLLMGISRTAEDLLNPLNMIIRAVPLVSWLSSILVIWGIGFNAPVFIVVIVLLPLIVFNISAGVKNVDIKLLEMAKVFKVSTSKKLKGIYLGSVIPFLLSAVRVSIGTMWRVAIVAEYMASDSGLGIKIANSKFYLDTPSVLAFTLAAVISGMILEFLFEFYIKKSKLIGMGI